VVEQLNEHRNEVGVDDWLDWRIVLNRKKTSETNASEELDGWVFLIDHFTQILEVRNLQIKLVINVSFGNLPKI
jgi:hypothetical protein